jgi:hypothetical protein
VLRGSKCISLVAPATLAPQLLFRCSNFAHILFLVLAHIPSHQDESHTSTLSTSKHLNVSESRGRYAFPYQLSRSPLLRIARGFGARNAWWKVKGKPSSSPDQINYNHVPNIFTSVHQQQYTEYFKPRLVNLHFNI